MQVKKQQNRTCNQIGKGVHQGCILSPCLYNFHAKYIMQNAGLDEAQAGIKIARRNVSSLRYADDTTLLTVSEEELKKFLMKVKEESEEVCLKLNIKNLRSWHPVPIISLQIDGETMERVTEFIFLGSKSTADGDCSQEIKTLAPWKKSYDKTRRHIKKQRHCFANKILYSQSYGFSSSYILRIDVRVGP